MRPFSEVPGGSVRHQTGDARKKGVEDEFKAIQAGEANVTVRQDPARMVKEGINLIPKILWGAKPEPKTLIPGLLIMKDNVDQFLQQ